MTVLDAYIRVRDLKNKKQIMDELKRLVMEELAVEEEVNNERSTSTRKSNESSDNEKTV